MAFPFFLWIVLAMTLLSTVKCKETRHHNATTEWDFLMFSQHWPITVCHDWKDKSQNHSCLLPKPEQSWTIHGIWPNKIGTKGPMFCNNTWHFNPDQIRSIEPALNELWINIEKDTPIYSLWAHEWSKHGTCAALLPNLHSELLYFGQGLNWQRKYSMNSILASGDIFPNVRVQYKLEDIHKTIKSYLGVEPVIECKLEHKFNYLFELRLCFNKNLDLIDCVGDKNKINGVDIQSNCKSDLGILYLPTVPLAKSNTKFYVNLYWLISWLQWLTL